MEYEVILVHIQMHLPTVSFYMLHLQHVSCNVVFKMNPQSYIASGSGSGQPKGMSLVRPCSGTLHPINWRFLTSRKTTVFSLSGSEIICIVFDPEHVGISMLRSIDKRLQLDSR